MNLTHGLRLSVFYRDDRIKWNNFLCYWPFVRGIHRSPVDSPHKSQWRGALMFYLMCTWTNRWANIRDASDLRCHRAQYYVTVMLPANFTNTLDGSFHATGPSHSKTIGDRSHEFTQTENKTKQNKTIPWICYERSFSEFYPCRWNQLVFNSRLQLFVQSPQP